MLLNRSQVNIYQKSILTLNTITIDKGNNIRSFICLGQSFTKVRFKNPYDKGILENVKEFLALEEK